MDLTALKDALLDIIYPPSLQCIICGQRKEIVSPFEVCQDCCDVLPFIRPPFCIKCGKPVISEKETCPDCREQTHYFKQAQSVFEYTQSIQKLIYQFKYQKHVYLGKPLGAWMAEHARRNRDWKVDVVIPVPLHFRRKRKRGFNQAEKLAREIAGEIKREMAAQCLARTKDTPTQVTLDKHQRAWNLWDAFVVREPEKVLDKTVLLVDDVYTTGSTVDQCSRVLLEAGARAVYVLTLATGRNV